MSSSGKKDPPKGVGFQNGKDPTEKVNGSNGSKERELHTDLADAGAFGTKTEDRFSKIRDQSAKQREIRRANGSNARGITPKTFEETQKYQADRSHMRDSAPLPATVGDLDDSSHLLTDEQRMEYLRCLAVVKDPINAANRVGIDPQIFREARERDPKFLKECEDVLKERRYVQYMKSCDWRIRPRVDLNGNIYKPNIDIRRDHLPQLKASICEFGSLAKAAESVGSSLTRLKKFMEGDPEFKAEIEDAIAVYGASLEQAAHERAVIGYDVPIYGGRFKDELVGFERRYSDGLLKMLLQKTDPAYKDQQKIEVAKTTTIKHEIDFAALPQDSRAQLKAMLERLREQKERGALPAAAEDSQEFIEAEVVEKEPEPVESP